MSFVIKLRGSPATSTTFADYECPLHGRFEARVERVLGEAPDVIPCPCLVNMAADVMMDAICGEPSEWRISAPLTRVNPIEAIKGKSQKPERKTWTDTRAVAEGQPLYDWHEDRAKIWEEKRKQDVMRVLRDDHGGHLIGGD